MNIYAVIIANMFFAFLMCIMNALAIRKYSGYHQEIHKTFIVPGISSAIMGIITYIVYHGSYAVLKSMRYLPCLQFLQRLSYMQLSYCYCTD